MKKILLALLLIPSLAWAGPEVPENETLSTNRLGAYMLGRANEGMTPIATPNSAAVAPSHDRYGNAYVNIRSGLQTPIPVSAQAIAALTPATLVTVQATAIPTAYSTPQVAAVAGTRYLQINNASDAKLLCSYGANTDHFEVLAGTVFYMNFAASGVTLDANVNCHNADDGTNTGTVSFAGYK